MRALVLTASCVAAVACVQDAQPQQAPPYYAPHGPQEYAYGYGAAPNAPQPQWTAEPTSPPPPPQPGGDRFAAARQRCFDETNAYRAKVGVPPLARRPDKEACSDVDAQGDATRGTVHGESGHCRNMAQNECPGWPGPADRMTPSCLASMFQEGPGEPYIEHGHYINMTNRDYTGLACGFFERRDGKIWLVQNYFK